jgi:hypothetical protein
VCGRRGQDPKRAFDHSHIEFRSVDVPALAAQKLIHVFDEASQHGQWHAIRRDVVPAGFVVQTEIDLLRVHRLDLRLTRANRVSWTAGRLDGNQTRITDRPLPVAFAADRAAEAPRAASRAGAGSAWRHGYRAAHRQCARQQPSGRDGRDPGRVAHLRDRRLGLGHIRLGQSATTLSGGEAQRVKLALELSKRDTGRTLYILDEPTTGLHFADIDLLLRVLHTLRDAGNTIVVIEHNLDVIKTADWIVDMGPEGGAGGGTVLVAGTPEQVAAEAGSFTGRYLRPLLDTLN